MAKSKVPYIAEGPGESSRSSRSVRKIDNGYLVTESHDGPNGYSMSERFEESIPSAEQGGERYSKATLGAAIAKLKG